MEEKDRTPEILTDDESIMLLIEAAEAVRKGDNIKLNINGRVWHVRPTSQAQNNVMIGLDNDVSFWINDLKAAKTAKEAKRLNTCIRKAYAKKAACKVLGKKLRWIPFMYAYMWRRIYHCSEAVSATINATESIGENKVFYLANLGSSKQALALSMTRVGEAAKQLTRRMESAESMVEQDGLPKKEGSK